MSKTRSRRRRNSRCWSRGGGCGATAPSLNMKTARSWRGIVTSTHLAREGRMTVTIGRRELLAALGGAAVAWPIAARAAAGEAADYRVSGHDLSCGLGAHGLRLLR